ncbi:MAG: hypothetical protein IPK82_12280 [Polyangiaceae bacterium]|nr:hypothetical protein [Polyangiaceae bacterium]
MRVTCVRIDTVAQCASPVYATGAADCVLIDPVSLPGAASIVYASTAARLHRPFCVRTLGRPRTGAFSAQNRPISPASLF